MSERDEKGRFIKGHKQLNTGNTHFKKGVKVRLGAKHSEESKAKMSLAKIGIMPTNIEFLRTYPHPQAEQSHMWKGDFVGYSALHKWVYKNLGKAKMCTHCGTNNYVEWANKSHEYKRDLEDWLELCRKCHKKYDKKH